MDRYKRGKAISNPAFALWQLNFDWFSKLFLG